METLIYYDRYRYPSCYPYRTSVFGYAEGSSGESRRSPSLSCALENEARVRVLVRLELFLAGVIETMILCFTMASSGVASNPLISKVTLQYFNTFFAERVGDKSALFTCKCSRMNYGKLSV